MRRFLLILFFLSSGIIHLNAQVYGAKTLMNKLNVVFFDTSVYSHFEVTDVVQNNMGIWTVGMLSTKNPGLISGSTAYTAQSDSILLVRFDDTGSYQWHIKLNIDQYKYVSPRLFTTNDNGVIILGNHYNDEAEPLVHPWVIYIGPAGNVKWVRELEAFSQRTFSLFSGLIERDNGDFWISGCTGSTSANTFYGENQIYPYLLKLDRNGNVLGSNIFKEPNPANRKYNTDMQWFSDFVSLGNQFAAVGSFMRRHNNNQSYAANPVVTIFDSIGNFQKNIYLIDDNLNFQHDYEISKVVQRQNYPSQLFLIGTFFNYSSSVNENLQTWVACLDVLKDSILWQNRYDTIESKPFHAYMQNDKLVILNRSKRQDGSPVMGFMQLDTTGKWEFANQMKIGNFEIEYWAKMDRVKSAIPLKNNGFCVVGNSFSQDTAHILLAIANPCDPKFCANLGATSIGPIQQTFLKIGPTQIPTSISRNVKPIVVQQAKMPTVQKRNICKNCVLPTLNVTDSVFCNSQVNIIVDLKDANCLINWNDGDTASIKQFNNPGKYWVTKTNTCGLNTDTFYLRQSFKPVKILSDSVKFCVGNNFEINATQNVPGIFSYTWNNGNTGPIQKIRDSQSLILITQESICGSRKDTVNVKLINCGCEMCIPNSFTPYNKDGVNDFWIPETKCMNTQCELQGGSYMIYNRWGEKIVDKVVSEAWDGRDVFGDFVPSGVYVYLIEVVYDQTNGSSKVVRKTGNITIL